MPRWNTCPDLVRRDVSRHYGPHAHQGTRTYAEMLPHQGARADVGTPADTHATPETNAGCQGGEVADDVIMGEGHVRHDRDVRSDGHRGGQDCLGKQDAARSYLRGSRDRGRGVNDRREI